MPGTLQILRARKHHASRKAGSHRLRSLAHVLAALLSFLGGLAVLALALTFSNLAAALPPVQDMEAIFGPSGREAFRPVRFYDRDEAHLLFEHLNPAASEMRWIYLDPSGPIDLPPYALQAMLIALDEDFWSHPGYHPAQALSAITDYLLGTPADWSSLTITERLAQAQLTPLYAGAEDAGAARVQALLLAAELTRRYSREQILEWYLNSADFGQQAFGIDAAALTYFGKHASDLTLAESALLASLPLNPAENPIAAPQAATQKQLGVLRSMLQAGLISEPEAQQAGAARPVLANQSELQGNLAAFETYLIQQIERSFGRSLLGRSGLRIRTSLEWDLHQQAACTLESQMSRLNGGEPGLILPTEDGSSCLAAGLLTPVRPKDAGVNHAIESAAIVITNPKTGELLSMLGQVSPPEPVPELTSPFTALTAFAQGYSPASMLLDVSPANDEPGSAGLGSPDHGPVRLRVALANQYQAALARLLDQVGAESAQRTLASFGFADPASLTEDGGKQGEKHLLELVSAYGVFADQGTLHGIQIKGATAEEHLEPVAILLIEDGTRRLLYQAEPASQALVSAQLAYLMVDVLSDESARWPSVGKGSPLEIGRTAAAVTTTSPGADQAWTLGFTPEIVVGVAFEAEEAAGEEALTALNGPAPVWHALIQYATRDLPPSAWTLPPGVSTLEVCDPSGLLPTPYCPSIVREVFLNGTEPTTADNLFQPFLVNRETGKLATLSTPPELVEEQVFMVVPPGAEAWAEQSGITRPPEEYDTLRAEEIDPQVTIQAPAPFAFLRGEVTIMGTADTEALERFRVQYGRGLNPTSWVQIGEDSERRVLGGRLATWDTSSLSGLYTLQLVVVEDSGRLRTAGVQVTVDNQAPTAEITLPESGQVIVGSIEDSLVLQADVADEYGVARVVFYVDGQVAGTLTDEPYSLTWRLSRSGEHSVEVEAFDLAGNSFRSAPITFSVNRP